MLSPDSIRVKVFAARQKKKSKFWQMFGGHEHFVEQFQKSWLHVPENVVHRTVRKNSLHQKNGEIWRLFYLATKTLTRLEPNDILKLPLRDSFRKNVDYVFLFGTIVFVLWFVTIEPSWIVHLPIFHLFALAMVSSSAVVLEAVKSGWMTYDALATSRPWPSVRTAAGEIITADTTKILRVDVTMAMRRM